MLAGWVSFLSGLCFGGIGKFAYKALLFCRNVYSALAASAIGWELPPNPPLFLPQLLESCISGLRVPGSLPHSGVRDPVLKVKILSTEQGQVQMPCRADSPFGAGRTSFKE